MYQTENTCTPQNYSIVTLHPHLTTVQATFHQYGRLHSSAVDYTFQYVVSITTLKYTSYSSVWQSTLKYGRLHLSRLCFTYSSKSMLFRTVQNRDSPVLACLTHWQHLYPWVSEQFDQQLSLQVQLCFSHFVHMMTNQGCSIILHQTFQSGVPFNTEYAFSVSSSVS